MVRLASTFKVGDKAVIGSNIIFGGYRGKECSVTAVTVYGGIVVCSVEFPSGTGNGTVSTALRDSELELVPSWELVEA
jgi:hypothetical protein